jgi:ring-1,2-phenylacetyl-CoA epoxidase subunit PaaD
VPVLSIRELGVLRDVEVADDEVTIIMTPTYSGCPAMHAMEAEVVETLARHGVPNARVKTVYSPAWTTDWMSDEAKAEARGVRDRRAGPRGVRRPRCRFADALPVRCPYCRSVNTTMRSEFGSTACKAILFCNGCSQPFELFKAI